MYSIVMILNVEDRGRRKSDGDVTMEWKRATTMPALKAEEWGHNPKKLRTLYKLWKQEPDSPPGVL